MRIHHPNPRERDAEQFLKLLHHKLDAGEPSAVRHRLLGEDRLMCRTFFADLDEAAWCAASFVCDEVYTDAASRRGEAC